MFNRDRDLLQGHWERKDRKCFCRVNCSKSWEMIWARGSVELITRLVWWNVCSKLNIKDQRKAVGFCLDFALKVMESQQKGRTQCILQDSLGSSVWEALKGKMEACFIFFLNLQLPQFLNKGLCLGHQTSKNSLIVCGACWCLGWTPLHQVKSFPVLMT